jgi:uncharacterized protein (DUF1684 family)
MKPASLYRSVCVVGLFCSIGVSLRAVRAADDPAITDTYRQAFEKWKSELVEDRRENWLTLVGLFWLKPGDNSFGSDASNTLVLPGGTAPAHAGIFKLHGKDVTVAFQPGVTGSVAGQPAGTMKLDPDVSGHPTVVELGSLRMHVIQRGARCGIRVKDLKSPAAAKYRGADFYPLGVAYRINATWVPGNGKRTVLVPNILGDATASPVVGEARFTIDGREVRLSATSGDPEHGLFFIFSDATRKTETYPAGRFLLTAPVKDGHVLLDFNQAYNPPCAVTRYATCPLPPKENQLPVRIAAGEKFDHAQKHP